MHPLFGESRNAPKPLMTAFSEGEVLCDYHDKNCRTTNRPKIVHLLEILFKACVDLTVFL